MHPARVDRCVHLGLEDGRALRYVVPGPLVYVLGDQGPRQLDDAPERKGDGGKQEEGEGGGV